jgi:serine phosphatase RsbU (regulator of sigma subunit)
MNMDPISEHSLTGKYNRLSDFANKFWPDLDSLSDQRRLVGTGDVLTFLYTFPLAVIGITWLVFVSDLQVFQKHYLFLILNFGLLFLFSRLSFFTIFEIRADRYGSSEDSLASIVQWSAVFLLGPTALWLSVFYDSIDFVLDWRNSTTPAHRWTILRSFSTTQAINTFSVLVSLIIYTSIGGVFPISGLTETSVSRAFVALICQFLIAIIIVSGYLAYHIGLQRILDKSQEIKPLVRFFLTSVALPFLANPFSILLAGLFIDNGFVIYAFLLSGLILVAYLARRLSLAAEISRQQSKQLERLEKLGRDLLEVIPDTSSLPEILANHVPGMFPSGRISIWISPDQILLSFPTDWMGVENKARDWIMNESRPRSFLAKENLPWDDEQNDHLAMIINPIFRTDSGRAIGGIVVELRELAPAWDKQSLRNLFPGIQSLADQIASTLQQAEAFEQSLNYQQITQELKLAGQIQSSFLPNKFPPLKGWQLAVTLLPARETSGDFFDVIELEDDRIGILVADVADKGLGSALYMALSRTLIRTYAEEYDAAPEVVFFAANNRLLKDARANLFITTFYGILDPQEGTLTYCNAGHNPPYLIRNSNQETIISLSRTGIAMGIEKDATWSTETVTINPGDVLLLYTDGIPDAQDADGDFFDNEAIIEIAQDNAGQFAFEIQSSIIEKVQEFMADTPQDDDITLMVLVRDKTNPD